MHLFTLTHSEGNKHILVVSVPGHFLSYFSFEFQNAFLFEMGLIQDAQTQMLPDQRYTCVVYIRTSFMLLQQCQIILNTFKRINEHY